MTSRALKNLEKFSIIYLKFPLLDELDLARKGEPNFLFLKIEVFKEFGFCKNFKIEIAPVFKFGRSILIRTFDLPTLMATKLRAILYRKWRKIDRAGKVLIKVKGRDYYDLMWYFQEGVKPNLKCINKIKKAKELKEKLLKIIKNIDSRSIKLDLEGLIENRDLVKDLSKNLKRILISQLSTRLCLKEETKEKIKSW